MIYTIGDVARELSVRYHKEKEKVVRKGDLWLKICEDLFMKYGERFEYSDLSSFKSILRNLQKGKVNNRASNKNVIKLKTKTPRQYLGSGEGLTTFTQQQIKYLGLNPDSY